MTAALDYPVTIQYRGRVWHQTREAARRLGISRVRVYQLVTTGRLPAIRHGRLYYVDDLALRHYETGRLAQVLAELHRVRAARTKKS